ncbi:MAG TPA: glycine cleavage T C-terminal barrel domain-containing protein [Verrucomicrobiae bacterium]|nr:glycine cleavage T C-terminal barrel domain-containing protein [Verrucomicrobiae bacterium]
MNLLFLHQLHQSAGGRFSELNGQEIVADYGDVAAEYAALREAVGVLDFNFRGRICLTGSDRIRFLHGQITNDVKRLSRGEGCYAAITTAKGKMEGDLNIFNLPDELLLDFEPGLTDRIFRRLEKFIVADDVQVVDAAPHYGLLTVQGPKAAQVAGMVGFLEQTTAREWSIAKVGDGSPGEIYVACVPRLAAPGLDIFVPRQSLRAVADKLTAAAKSVGGRPCGWTAFELARIESGVPRFGADMDETNLPMECIESRGVSFNKGCYIGQEVLNRIHAMGHVNKALRGLRLSDDLQTLPGKGAKLFHNGKEAGYITSAARSPALNANIALGYVRREANQPGTDLVLQMPEESSAAKIVDLPFVKG